MSGFLTRRSAYRPRALSISTPHWAYERAYAEVVFEGEIEMIAWQAGIPSPATVVRPILDAVGLHYRSDDPLVRLIGEAVRTPLPDGQLKLWTPMRSVEDFKSQNWIAPYRDRVDGFLAETRKRYGL